MLEGKLRYLMEIIKRLHCAWGSPLIEILDLDTTLDDSLRGRTAAKHNPNPVPRFQLQCSGGIPPHQTLLIRTQIFCINIDHTLHYPLWKSIGPSHLATIVINLYQSKIQYHPWYDIVAPFLSTLYQAEPNTILRSQKLDQRGPHIHNDVASLMKTHLIFIMYPRY